MCDPGIFISPAIAREPMAWAWVLPIAISLAVARPIGGSAPSPLDLPITWISAGDRPGQAVILGTPIGPGASGPKGLTAWLERQQPAAPLELSVLQYGHGTITLGLPAAFRLAQWRLKLCVPGGGDKGGAVLCTVPRALYAPDLAWTTCDGAVCSPGAVLRLFGRRPAFDADGCRPHNVTDDPTGTELEVVLTPHLHPRESAAPVVRLVATSQSCHEARFLIPPATRLGR